jgi:sugar lactone lactonase YvrE
MDEYGRVYVADNVPGKIWRIDPDSGGTVLIAEGMPNIASLVFGEGEFDREALYVTSTFQGGGTIWKVPVGVRGAPVVR